MADEIISKSFKDIFKNILHILKILIITSLVLYIIDEMSRAFASSSKIDLLNIFFSLLRVFTISIISINLFRTFILDEQRIPILQVNSFSKKEFIFFKNLIISILMIIGVFLVTVLLIPKSYSAAILFSEFIFLVYVLARISLVFPSISINENMSIKKSWEYTKSYNNLILKNLVFMPILFSIFISTLVIIIKLFLIPNENIYLLIPLLINIFWVSILSNTFMYIIYDIEVNN